MALKRLMDRKLVFIEKLKKEWGYSYVDLDSVVYPGKHDPFVTIEVVTPKQPERLHFVTPIYKAIHTKPKNDLIDKMHQYQVDGMMSFIKNRLLYKQASCPVYHCTLGFSTPELKPYLNLFNVGAVKQRALILNTIKSDPEAERRASAVFLLGHFKDPHEIIRILLPYVNDSDSGVRNNVMRVIGFTMKTAKIYNIDVRPFVAMLDSPYESDRNKAMLVLYVAADSKISRDAIKKYGTEKLMALLALRQPNNHDSAYNILKKISGKNFGEHNIAAWKKWARA